MGDRQLADKVVSPRYLFILLLTQTPLPFDFRSHVYWKRPHRHGHHEHGNTNRTPPSFLARSCCVARVIAFFLELFFPDCLPLTPRALRFCSRHLPHSWLVAEARHRGWNEWYVLPGVLHGVPILSYSTRERKGNSFSSERASSRAAVSQTARNERTAVATRKTVQLLQRKVRADARGNGCLRGGVLGNASPFTSS